jgi:hypothetical protein
MFTKDYYKRVEQMQALLLKHGYNYGVDAAESALVGYELATQGSSSEAGTVKTIANDAVLGVWNKSSTCMPDANSLIAKRWKTGAVWAGNYSGLVKDSSFDEWCYLPVVSQPSAQPSIKPRCQVCKAHGR